MSEQARWRRGDVVVLRELLETRCTRAYEELTGDHGPESAGLAAHRVGGQTRQSGVVLPRGNAYLALGHPGAATSRTLHH